MASILVKNQNGDFSKYELESRSELSSVFYQSLLSEHHLAGRVIKCGCSPKKELWLSVVSRGGFFLRTFPKITQAHEDDCIFSNNASEFYDEETQTYSLSIFKEPTKSEADENSSNAMKRIMAKATVSTGLAAQTPLPSILQTKKTIDMSKIILMKILNTASIKAI